MSKPKSGAEPITAEKAMKMKRGTRLHNINLNISGAFVGLHGKVGVEWKRDDNDKSHFSPFQLMFLEQPDMAELSLQTIEDKGMNPKDEPVVATRKQTPDSAYRDGDLILVRAKVSVSGQGKKDLIVQFKNGDSLPIKSVEIDSVEEYSIRKGDEIVVDSRGGDEIGMVQAVIMDSAPPQVVYTIPGKWPLQTAILKDCKRYTR